MTTYVELREKIARAIQDPDNETFSDDTIKDVVSSVWPDLGRVAPEQYTEDITPLADTLSYALRADVFDSPNPDIELRNVEVWDTDATPNQIVYWVTPKKGHFTDLAHSQAGWEVWGGTLYLPNRIVAGIDVDSHAIRVWGYSPWEMPVADEDVMPFPQSYEEALIIGANVGILRRLTNNRALFTAWQTRSNNTDVSMASLMNDLESAKDEWRRLTRAIQVAREGV
jgi:hypothetical protein